MHIYNLKSVKFIHPRIYIAAAAAAAAAAATKQHSQTVKETGKQSDIQTRRK